MKKINDDYLIAERERNSYGKYNNFNISEIQKKSKFYNWVECKVNDAISFNMFLAGGDDGVALKLLYFSYEFRSRSAIK